MRSMFFALAVTAVTLFSTGCTMSCKFSGPCKSLTQTCSVDCDQNGGWAQGQADCGGNCGGNCGDAACAGGCPNGLLGGGCATGMRGKRLGMGLFERGTMCADGSGNCGTDCATGDCNTQVGQQDGCSDGNCGLFGGGLFAGIRQGGMRQRAGFRTGMMAGAATDNGCGTAGCGTNGQVCDGCSGGAGLFGGLGGRGAGLNGGRGAGLNGGMGNGFNAGVGNGCGTPGCGLNGRMCGGCARGRGLGMGLGQGHPYGGQIPHTPAPYAGGTGGATPSYAYPYYTTRGPRDFLMANPPSIGR